GTAWNLSGRPGQRSVALTTYLSDVAGVIPLPHAASRIRDVNATEITRNRYGSVKMEIKEGWTSYTAEFGDGPARDAAPADRDLFIAENYRDTFSELAQQLDLNGKEPSYVMEAVRDFFLNGFTYSLTLQHRYPRGKYLAEFLFSTRSGHCEFFATSTVLLLRAAGVPARYAVGFAVDEYSPLEGQYVARARHAHSWALAYVDGAWQVLDTTPSVWSPLERAQASGFEPLFDLISWISFKYARWQSDDAVEEETDNRWLLWLLVPLLATLGWRLYFKERVDRKTGPARRDRRLEYPGSDSGLYRLVTGLEKAGFRRRQGETLRAWLGRIEGPLREAPWRAALAIHYRYRFDPAGISREERDTLDRHVDAALAAIARV
ncbi:MAG: transglutaminase-like domain-containing protein, partial [Burkholderiales bacterium]